MLGIDGLDVEHVCHQRRENLKAVGYEDKTGKTRGKFSLYSLSLSLPFSFPPSLILTLFLSLLFFSSYLPLSPPTSPPPPDANGGQPLPSYLHPQSHTSRFVSRIHPCSIPSVPCIRTGGPHIISVACPPCTQTPISFSRFPHDRARSASTSCLLEGKAGGPGGAGVRFPGSLVGDCLVLMMVGSGLWSCGSRRPWPSRLEDEDEDEDDGFVTNVPPRRTGMEVLFGVIDFVR